MGKPRHKWQEINARKSARYTKVGLGMEEKIASFLRQATDETGRPIFEKVIKHQQFSTDDLEGKDITVFRRINNTTEKRSFGVTISMQSFNKTKDSHEYPVFYTPTNHNPDRLLIKVLKLFEK